MRYAKKVQQNPLNSYVYEDDQEKRELYKQKEKIEAKSMNARQKYASFAAFIFIGILVYGVLEQGWFMVEMAGLFIFMGVVVGLIAGLNATQISNAFTDGFREVLMGAIIVGLARSSLLCLKTDKLWIQSFTA